MRWRQLQQPFAVSRFPMYCLPSVVVLHINVGGLALALLGKQSGTPRDAAGEVMIIELMSISVSQAQAKQLGDALESLAGPIQVQPGCLECRLLKSLPSDKRMYLMTRWETQKDLIRHLQSDSYKKLLLLMELSATPPELQFFNVLEIRGLDLVEAVRNSSD